MQNTSPQTETALQRIVDRVPDVIFRYRFRPDRAFDYINDAATRITGYTPDEFYADPELHRKLDHPDDRAVLRTLFRTGWSAGPQRMRWVRKDGAVIWVEQRILTEYDASGAIAAIEGVARQIDDPTAGAVPTIRISGGVRIDLLERQVFVDGREVHLTPAEFKLLLLLTERPGHTVSRGHMMKHLWRSAHTGDGHTCEAHVSNLRKKIEPDSRNPTRIITVRGSGYRFAT